MSSVEFIKRIIPTLSPIEVFEYYDGPRFYTCRDDAGQFYLIRWIEDTDLKSVWLYMRTSPQRLKSLKNGLVSIKEALQNPEDSFAYLVGLLGEAFDVTEISKSDILDEWLPSDQEYLNINSGALPEKELEAEEFSKSSLREVLDIAFVKEVNAHEMSCSKLGNLLTAIQATINSLMFPADSDVKKIPDHVRYRSELNLTALFSSSFGIRLLSRSSEFVEGGELAKALESFAKVLAHTETPELITKNLKNVNILARSRFKNLLTSLVNAQVALKVDWSSPTGEHFSTHCTYDNISRSLTKLEMSDDPTKETRTLNGKLVGVDIENDFFAIITDEKILIKGKLSKDLMNGNNFMVPSRVKATIETTCTTNILTDHEKWFNKLVSLTNL